MTSLILRSGRLPDNILIPSSKSYANRMLILSAIYPGTFRLNNIPESTDVKFLIKALSEIGIQFETQGSDLTVKNHFPACESELENKILSIEVGEGGTTARFLASLLLLGQKEYHLRLGKRLKDRPWGEFIQLVQELKGKAVLKDDLLTIQGPIQVKKKLEVDCSRTTQFASGFQMALSSLGTEVIPKGLESSQSYWLMTEELVKSMKEKSSLDVPLDWSSASYALAFGALNHPIEFPGLYYDKFQADAKFYHLLDELCSLEKMDHGLRVIPAKKNFSVHLDVSDCLDLVPTLGYLLSHIDGRHELKGIENLKHKESDRLSEIVKLLSAFDRKTKVENDCLIIWGDSKKKNVPVKLELPDDHRMVMTGALFLRHHQGGEIGPIEAVAKSYPEFFKLFD
jgi:3-phosphoshikimate 1-carboxyvinyltransferase